MKSRWISFFEKSREWLGTYKIRATYFALVLTAGILITLYQNADIPIWMPKSLYNAFQLYKYAEYAKDEAGMRSAFTDFANLMSSKSAETGFRVIDIDTSSRTLTLIPLFDADYNLMNRLAYTVADLNFKGVEFKLDFKLGRANASAEPCFDCSTMRQLPDPLAGTVRYVEGERGGIISLAADALFKTQNTNLNDPVLSQLIGRHEGYHARVALNIKNGIFDPDFSSVRSPLGDAAGYLNMGVDELVTWRSDIATYSEIIKTNPGVSSYRGGPLVEDLAWKIAVVEQMATAGMEAVNALRTSPTAYMQIVPYKQARVLAAPLNLNFGDKADMPVLQVIFMAKDQTPSFVEVALPHLKLSSSLTPSSPEVVAARIAAADRIEANSFLASAEASNGRQLLATPEVAGVLSAGTVNRLAVVQQENIQQRQQLNLTIDNIGALVAPSQGDVADEMSKIEVMEAREKAQDLLNKQAFPVDPNNPTRAKADLDRIVDSAYEDDIFKDPEYPRVNFYGASDSAKPVSSTPTASTPAPAVEKVVVLSPAEVKGEVDFLKAQPQGGSLNTTVKTVGLLDTVTTVASIGAFIGNHSAAWAAATTDIERSAILTAAAQQANSNIKSVVYMNAGIGVGAVIVTIITRSDVPAKVALTTMSLVGSVETLGNPETYAGLAVLKDNPDLAVRFGLQVVQIMTGTVEALKLIKQAEEADPFNPRNLYEVGGRITEYGKVQLYRVYKGTKIKVKEGFGKLKKFFSSETDDFNYVDEEGRVLVVSSPAGASDVMENVFENVAESFAEDNGLVQVSNGLYQVPETAAILAVTGGESPNSLTKQPETMNEADLYISTALSDIDSENNSSDMQSVEGFTGESTGSLADQIENLNECGALTCSGGSSSQNPQAVFEAILRLNQEEDDRTYDAVNMTKALKSAIEGFDRPDLLNEYQMVAEAASLAKLYDEKIDGLTETARLNPTAGNVGKLAEVVIQHRQAAEEALVGSKVILSELARLGDSTHHPLEELLASVTSAVATQDGVAFDTSMEALKAQSGSFGSEISVGNYRHSFVDLPPGAAVEQTYIVGNSISHGNVTTDPTSSMNLLDQVTQSIFTSSYPSDPTGGFPDSTDLQTHLYGNSNSVLTDLQIQVGLPTQQYYLGWNNTGAGTSTSGPLPVDPSKLPYLCKALKTAQASSNGYRIQLPFERGGIPFMVPKEIASQCP